MMKWIKIIMLLAVVLSIITAMTATAIHMMHYSNLKGVNAPRGEETQPPSLITESALVVSI